MPVTVNVTEPTRFGMVLDVTRHEPLAPVVHDPAPVTPPLQSPVTTAPATAWWFVSCTTSDTRAVHWFLFAVEDPSRSPT